MARAIWLALALLAVASAPAMAKQGRDPAHGARLERVVLLMRHGVRPPTKAAPLPPGLSAEPWPAWDAPYGNLTEHGRLAIERMGAAERRRLATLGVLPADGCPSPEAVLVWADTDQRTIATGEALLRGMAPGCGLAAGHMAPGADDALFSPIATGAAALDTAKALDAIRARLPKGGLDALADGQRSNLARLDRILGAQGGGPCPNPAGCRLALTPTGLEARPGQRPRLTGGLDLGSTAAQVLLLEYAEGKPMAQVGWGRANAADIQRLSALHALVFDLLARPPYIAARNAGPIALKMLAQVEAETPLRLSVLVGHDTNVAGLGGLLDLHWTTPGFAPDDPPPGGALGFEVWKDRAGRRFVRAVWIAQGASSIRAADLAGPRRRMLPIPGCAPRPDFCALASFSALVRGRAVPAGLSGQAAGSTTTAVP